MRSKAQVGMVFVLIGALIILVSFAFIEPLKESLDNNRGGDTLNCPGTPTFNQSLFDNQTLLDKLNYRPTCAVTGFSLVYFIGFILIGVVVWVYKNWRSK